MKVYVISLRTAADRRTFQQAQLTRLGLEYTIVDAVTTADLDKWNARVALDRWERPLMPTEVACFFSHYKLWQQVAASQEPALLLEDDALLSSEVPAFLNQVQNLGCLDHISLETRLRKKLLGRTRPLQPGMGIARMYQDRTGAAAYILWPNGAQKLVEHALVHGAALADAFISNLYGLNSWQATPALAVQSDVSANYGISTQLHTHSYIQANDRKANYARSGLSGLAFKMRRVASQLRQAGRFLVHIAHASRIQVPVIPQTFDNTQTS